MDVMTITAMRLWWLGGLAHTFDLVNHLEKLLIFPLSWFSTLVFANAFCLILRSVGTNNC